LLISGEFLVKRESDAIVDRALAKARSGAPRKKNGNGAHNADSALEPSLITRCAADIVPKRIEFLWPGRIARGKHTAIAGEPGDGKSQLSVFVTAIVTCGGLWPCNEGRAPVGNVIILNAEDGAEDTMIPRLMAAGADRQRVHIVNPARGADVGKGALEVSPRICLAVSLKNASLPIASDAVSSRVWPSSKPPSNNTSTITMLNQNLSSGPPRRLLSSKRSPGDDKC
jgi:AAA domain